MDDLKCFYAGLLVFYGFNNYRKTGEQIEIKEKNEKQVFRFSIGAVKQLYGYGIRGGFTPAMLDDYLKEYFCECRKQQPEAYRRWGMLNARVCDE